MKVGDLVKFKTGYIGIITGVEPFFSGTVEILIQSDGNLTFPNPIIVTMETLQKSAEILNEAR